MATFQKQKWCDVQGAVPFPGNMRWRCSAALGEVWVWAVSFSPLYRSPTVPAPLSAFPNQEGQGAQLFQTCLEQLAELSCNLEGNMFVIMSAGSSRFHGH